ncbi:MAG: hypothetical protein NC820_04555, partial [Candidatus Omnitrophica bacterium]|nr:hypothetical protein [Candidatus Omnitrophota bacterium]
FVSCFLLGLIISPVEVAIRSIIHRDSQDKFLGRIFSSLEMLIHTSLLFFMFISSYLADKVFTPFTIIVGVGIIVFTFAIFSLFSYDG